MNSYRSVGKDIADIDVFYKHSGFEYYHTLVGYLPDLKSYQEDILNNPFVNR